MKIKFLKDITVDCISAKDQISYEKPFHRNDCVPVWEILAESSQFSTIIDSNGDTLCDIRNDSFQEMV